MNKFFIVISIIGTTMWLGCTAENDRAASTATPKTDQQSVSPELEKPGFVGKANEVKDSRFARVLTRNYWVFEKYYHPEKAKKDLGKGRWFKFEKDGTFVSGRWEQQTANGSWRLYKRENKQYILLDSSIDSEDAEFEIQAINGDEDSMAWVGTPGYAEFDPVSLVISNLMTIPTKAQFGVQ